MPFWVCFKGEGEIGIRKIHFALQGSYIFSSDSMVLALSRAFSDESVGGGDGKKKGELCNSYKAA